jgi:hypothetical protein
MEFDEWYGKMCNNDYSALHHMSTQREKMRLAWNEAQRISNAPILSDVPTGNQVETLEERVLKLEKAMILLVSAFDEFNKKPINPFLY